MSIGLPPSHVVQAWIGHSRKTAETHYLSVTEDDFAKALEKEWSDSGQQERALDCSGSDQKREISKKAALQESALTCATTESGQALRQG